MDDMTDAEVRLALGALSRMRHRYPKKCAYCKKGFEGLNRSIYCSTRCRVAGWRLKHPDEAYKPSTRKRQTELQSEVEKFLKREQRAVEKVYQDRELSRKISKLNTKI